MATPEQTIANVLEGTIEALTCFDLERLSSLEEGITQLMASGISIQPVTSLLEKKTRLKRTLEETRANLDVLERLCSGKDRERWER